MNSEILALAMDEVDDIYLEDTRAALGYGVGRKRSAKTIRRAFLLAAVISLLLAAAGCAAAWFGLSARLTPIEVSSYGETAKRFSLDNYAGTATAEAGREWTEYFNEYEASHTFTNEISDSSLAEPELSYSMIYGAFDRAMLDRLEGISEKYGVKLHIRIYPAPDYETGLAALGIGDFIRGEADRGFKYIFEDGSFTVESYMHIGDTDELFSLMRCKKDSLNNGFMVFRGNEVYDEWEYVTETGQKVNIAVNEWSEHTRTLPIFILYDAGDYLVTVITHCPNTENIRAEGQKIAERFDFAALTGGELNTELLDAKTVELAQSHPVKPKIGLMTVSEFFETDEYKASAAFQRSYNDYLDTMNQGGNKAPGMYDQYYYDSFPAADEKINEIFDRVIEQYPYLRVATETQSVIMMLPVDADAMTSPFSYKGAANPTYMYESISMDALFRMLGTQPFIAEGNYTAVANNTGAFLLAGADFQLSYIPKGTFFPTVRFALDENGETWAYTTSCGEQVSIAKGGDYSYPVCNFNYALYETDIAYVFIQFEPNLGAGEIENILDGIDFTKLNELKPWGAEREITPRYIQYKPLTIMKENWYCKDEYLMPQAEKEYVFYTHEALCGDDTKGITWSVEGNDNVTLTDNGNGSCTLVYHGSERAAIKLTASRGADNFNTVIICEGR